MRTTTRVQVKHNQEDMRREKIIEYSNDEVECTVPEDSPSPYYFVFQPIGAQCPLTLFKQAVKVGEEGKEKQLWDYYHVHYVAIDEPSCHLICRKDVGRILDERENLEK